MDKPCLQVNAEDPLRIKTSGYTWHRGHDMHCSRSLKTPGEPAHAQNRHFHRRRNTTSVQVTIKVCEPTKARRDQTEDNKRSTKRTKNVAE